MDTPDILSFDGEYGFLSNFYLHRIGPYPSLENAYQASKLEASDDEGRTRLQVGCTPGQAKRLIHTMKVRSSWSQIEAKMVMRALIRVKFTIGSDLAKRLVATHPAKLVEGNLHGDTFWGECNGVGENNLGKILMEHRDLLVHLGEKP